MDAALFCKSYHQSLLLDRETARVRLSGEETAAFPAACCRAALRCEEDGSRIAAEAVFTFERTLPSPAAVGIQWEITDWSRENYVFFPGAVYAGNRFHSEPLPYPPYAPPPPGEAAAAPAVITAIPHLSLEEPASAIRLRSGDMTTPACGYFDPVEQQGLLLTGLHRCGEDYTGFSLREDLSAGKAWMTFSAPGVREGEKYFFGERRNGSGFYPDCHTLSDDQGRCFLKGDTVTIRFCLHRFSAHTLSAFFFRFNRIREELETGFLPDTVPFETAYHAVKEKYQRENFIEAEGYYAVGIRREVPQQCWQAGWIGGGINGYPFLLEDNGEAHERSLSTLRFIFDRLQWESGWISGMYANGIHYGDTFDLSRPGSALLVRKNADLLYFLLKQWLCPGVREALDGYEPRVRKLCDAFVRLYGKYGQIGQFIDAETGEMLRGGTASAGIAAGGLALAYECFGAPAYLEAAEGLGELYARDFLAKGILNGGPGEICQAPDSEAAFGTLESFVQLYETTGRENWLCCAKEAAELALTWVVSYDFHFPAESAAAKRGARTLGTVFANAQNKHSAPGICTLSGNSLLKLYRYTGDRRYLVWLRRIAHSLTQFVSLEERPVLTLDGVRLPAGYCNERVQTSDWEGKETIGGFLNGSNWPEVSMLLTYVEIPGIYVDFRTQTAVALDHVRCDGARFDGAEVALCLYNDSAFDAEFTLLIDDSGLRGKLRHNYFNRLHRVKLKAGEEKTLRLARPAEQ